MLQKTPRRLVELFLGINVIMKWGKIRESKRFTGPTVPEDQTMEEYF